MRKLILIVLISFYLFFLLGLLFHTSRNPTIFSKYSPTFFLGILLYASSFFVGYTLYRLYGKRRKVELFGRKITITSSSKIIGLTIVICLILIPCEFYFRTKYRNFESSSYRYTIDNFHPFLQAKLRPFEFSGVNASGFRNEEVSVVKPKNTFRIAILGGSTVLNREVSYEKSATYLLERDLQRKYPKVHIEIINGGKDWYTSEHSIIQYLFLIKDFHPDLVVMWHGINDLYASCTPSSTSYGVFKRDYSHMFNAISPMVFSYFSPPPVISIKLYTIDLLSQWAREVLYSDITSSLKKKAIESSARTFIAGGSDYANNVNFPSLSTYDRNLNTLIELLKTEATPLILGDQASLFKKNPSLAEGELLIFPAIQCREGNKPYSLQSYIKGLQEFNAVTKHVSKTQQIPFVEFSSAIPKDASYFVDSIHYSEKGNERIAELLYRKIIDEKYINE